MRLIGVWALLVFAPGLAQAQTSQDGSSDPTTSGATVTSGSTISINNSSTGIGVGTLNGSEILTFTGVVGNTLSLGSTQSSGTAQTTDSSSSSSLTFVGTTTTTASTIPPDTVSLVGGSSLTLNSGSLLVNGATTVANTNALTGVSRMTLSTGIPLFIGANTASSAFSLSGQAIVLGNSTGFSPTSVLSGLVQTGGTGTLTLNGSSSSLSVAVSNGSGTTSAANLILTSGGATTTVPGTISSDGTLTLSSGGSLNLAGIFNSSLTLVPGNTLGGTSLGTTGLSIATGSTPTGQVSGSMRVATLGSLPADTPPTGGSFASPSVKLLGIGDLGGQGISERGVIYSLTSANGSPTLGGDGVVKVVHTGLPDASGSFSLTAGGLAANANYTYRVYATNSSGVTILSQAGTFTTPTVLQNWRQTFFGTTQGASSAADNADPDGDGVPNLLEFATGKNPTRSQNAASTAPIVSGGNLEYQYTRSLDALNSGITFTVEWNDTLNPTQWSSAGVSEVVLSDDGVQQQVKASVPAGSNGMRFMRLKVLPPPAQ